MALFVVKTAVGREAQVMDFLASSAKRSASIQSLLHPHGMSGYIIIEAESADAIRYVSAGIPYVRRVLNKATTLAEIEHLIEFKPEKIDINKGDIVSIIAGPFKGSKAKVNRVDLLKAQVVVELLEAAVPIPITLTLDSVKLAEKAEDKNKNEPAARMGDDE